MAEPRIQYAQTTDGVSIAFCVMGEGPPLVHIAPAFPHLQLEWQIPKIRAWYERLAQRRKLIRYDWRGQGLSQREIPPSPESSVLDLEAVVGSLGLDRVALLGPWHGGPLAITYAARNPERVSHLVLWCAYARAADLTAAAQLQATRALIDRDWDTYAEAVAHLVFGWSAGDEARAFATLIRESTTPEAVQMGIRAMSEVDVTALMPQVQSPTLVLHRRGLRGLNVDVATGLASRIPQARLAILEGTALMPYLDDMESVAATIDEFLNEGEEPAAQAELPEGMAVILFADIADSTALTEELGDAAFREKARELDASLRVIIRECSGTPVEGKVLGDGVLAVFTSARQAIECALRCNGAGESVGLQLHLGIHAGDVIREGNNVYGGAVNIAARIAAASPPGEVLVSDTVRSLARTSAGVTFDDRGEHGLKGIEEPQRLFAVRGGADG